MTGQFRAELLKIRSTRTTVGVALGMIGIILLFSLLVGLLTKAPNLVKSSWSRRFAGNCHRALTLVEASTASPLRTPERSSCLGSPVSGRRCDHYRLASPIGQIATTEI